MSEKWNPSSAPAADGELQVLPRFISKITGILYYPFFARSSQYSQVTPATSEVNGVPSFFL